MPEQEHWSVGLPPSSPEAIEEDLQEEEDDVDEGTPGTTPLADDEVDVGGKHATGDEEVRGESGGEGGTLTDAELALCLSDFSALFDPSAPSSDPTSQPMDMAGYDTNMFSDFPTSDFPGGSDGFDFAGVDEGEADVRQFDFTQFWESMRPVSAAFSSPSRPSASASNADSGHHQESNGDCASGDLLEAIGFGHGLEPGVGMGEGGLEMMGGAGAGVGTEQFAREVQMLFSGCLV